QDGHGTPAPVSSSLVVDRTQLSAIGAPGSVVQRNVFVRNVSDHTVTVNASTRSLSAPQTIASGDASLNTATAPAFLDAFGTSRSFVLQAISVPAGHDRLDVTIAAQAPSGFAIRIILLDPNGAYTAYSIPQGGNNWAHVDVSSPAAGTWHAVFALSTSSGFNGPIHYLATTSDFLASQATVKAPTFKLKPGASRREAVLATLPAHPGDVSQSVQFAVNGGASASVPLTLRAVLPATGGQFTDTLTGGNGRGGVAMSRFYSLDVSPGSTDMSVGITLTDPNEVVLATLSGPDGQVSSFRSNTFTDSSGNLNLSNGLQLYRRNPEGGRWALALWAHNPASGASVSSPFTVNVAYDTAQVQGTPPNSLSTHLAAGAPVDVPIQVTNTGANTLTYFADPRLNATGTVSLDELSGNATIPLPQPAGVVPVWLVPSECTSATDVVSADQPVNLDFAYNSGEPDVYAAHVGNGASVTVDADQVSPGLWAANVGQVGPFAGPAPAGTANLSATAHCNLFDTNTSSTTGDIWTAGVSGQSPKANFHFVDGKLVPSRPTSGTAGSPAPTGPVTLAPGQSATITVTITPAGASGTGVKGHIYIDTFDFFTDGGDEVASIPYKYTIA
ncbi:MAG TPA: hypothetical protein VNN79_03150, partial [Actinomycetota bacterium]|nr:hypothetical protein [Actinomycetota bacterium]